MNLHGLIISAPFGNFLNRKYATSTLGTFTLQRRPGRLLQILKTVRYSYTLDAWVNKLGLRNPGFKALYEMSTPDVKDKIISIHGFDTDEWLDWFVKIDDLMVGCRLYIEFNLSCPNVTDKPLDYHRIFTEAKQLCLRHTIIVKLPPVHWQPIFNAALDAGLRHFHCCNTLPVHCGGMSGAPLKRYSLDVIREIRKVSANEIFIIGGGGIRTCNDIKDYRDAGANRVAVASTLFNPYRLLFCIQSLAAYADKLFCNSVDKH